MKKKLIVIILCMIISLSLIISYCLFSLKPLDNFFYQYIIMLKTPIITQLFKLFTYLGSGITICSLIVILLLINRKKGFYFLINIIFVMAINLLLKNIFMRSRPMDINLIIETGYSFPSGHAMASMASYGLIIYYLYHSNLKDIFKKISIILLTVLIILIPISRVYLGVHFFSDVLLGVSLSLIWLMIYTEYLKKKSL